MIIKSPCGSLKRRSSLIKIMHKLITLSDQQYENAVEVMKMTRIESFSEFFRFLVLFYEQNQKRPLGRPRSKKDDTDDEDDQIEKYAAPDYPRNASRYSYAGLVAYYDYDKRRGPMPTRSSLQIHPDWLKEQGGNL